ncbi:AfsR/SARP family transcriptional regulator [Streptosporangium sp. NPDC004631]
MLFRALGPLTLVGDVGDPVEIRRGKHSTLVALLLYAANSPLPQSYLIEHLWHGRPPQSAASNLKTYIAQLRRLMSPADPASAPIRTSRNSYKIEIKPDDLDTSAFETFTLQGREQAHTGNHSDAAELFAAGLRLWRGPALHGADLGPELMAWAEQLQEERLIVTEELVNAWLALGQHAEITGRLHSLADRYPLRERFHAQLMTSLYRSGRQAEALHVYQRLRRVLVEQIGVEPTPEVRELHQRILRGDSSLDLHLTAGQIAERARMAALSALRVSRTVEENRIPV